jgi:hypothetical protein
MIGSMNRLGKIALVTCLSAGLAGCASHRPVLSPNEHLSRAGADTSERDIDDCIARAKVASTEHRTTGGENVVAGTAASSVVGAAAGGAGGAVLGHAAQGAAAGAAGGAAASLTAAFLRMLFSPKAPDTTRPFVERCLREKGYEPAEWK